MEEIVKTFHLTTAKIVMIVVCILALFLFRKKRFFLIYEDCLSNSAQLYTTGLAFVVMGLAILAGMKFDFSGLETTKPVMNLSQSQTNTRVEFSDYDEYDKYVKSLVELGSSELNKIYSYETNGYYFFYSVKEISDTGCKTIGRHEGYYSFPSLQVLTDYQLYNILRLDNPNSLQLGLKKITDAQAIDISNFNNAILLDSLEDITDDQYGILMTGSGLQISLGGIEDITIDNLRGLSKSSWSQIDLDGLKIMTDDMAEIFSRFKAKSIGLRGIEKISEYQYWKIINKKGSKEQGGPNEEGGVNFYSGLKIY